MKKNNTKQAAAGLQALTVKHRFVRGMIGACRLEIYVIHLAITVV